MPTTPSITVLTQGKVNSPGSTTVTASVAPSPNKLQILIVAVRSFNSLASSPTATGNGLTWRQYGSAFITDSNAIRVQVLTAVGASPTPGTITINFGTSISAAEWILLEVDDAYYAGAGGSAALGQFLTNANTGNTGNVTMGTFNDAVSGTLGIFGLASNQDVTPDPNFTEIAEQSGTSNPMTLEVGYRSVNDGSIDPTWTTSSKWCGIGIELRPKPDLSNDDFADAIALSTTLPGSRIFNTTWEATYEVGEPILSVNDQSVWYTFTPTATDYYKFRFYNVKFNGTNAFNIGTLGVVIRDSTTLADFDYTNTETLVAQLSANDFGSPTGVSTEVIIRLEAGKTYTIKAYSGEGSGTPVHNSWTVSYDMSWEIVDIDPPANDNWDDAEIMSTSLPGSTAGTTYDSTTETGEYYSPGQEQSVWYKFTPAVTGFYLIRFPASGFGEYPSINSWASIYMFDGTGATKAGDLGNSEMVGNTNIDFDDQQDGLIAAELTAGTPYYIQVFSGTSQGFNSHAMSFTLEWDIAPPIDNDDFADATEVTGASGSEDFVTLGSSFETSGGEPPSGPYNDPQTKGTVWFKWVCPATDDYKFEVQLTDEPIGNWAVKFDLAIWTGGALNALTSVVRNYGGEEPLSNDQRGAGTAVGFPAVSGTTYWIQVTNWSPEHGSAAQLTWGLNTITGNTTSDPAPFLNGRTHTHGNDETEPPPDFAARLSAHESWWFTDGQVGKVKWFKYEATETKDVNINGVFWNGFPNSGTARPGSDAALLVYKGADYASLTPATTTVAQGSVDAAMMVKGLTFESGDYWFSYFATEDDIVHMEVPVSPGDVLWVCLFGLYDADYAEASPSDAHEYEVDVIFGDPPPANDNLEGAIDVTQGNQIHAYKIAGTTVDCTAEVGEPAHGGYGPTRSAWYRVRMPWQGGDFKFWVESDEDCVMSIYLGSAFPSAWFDLESKGEDDDSGTGNWPEITLNDVFGSGYYFIAVDSKVPTDFVLKYQRLSTGTPPANDDFANAEVHVGAFAASGTTVGATGEVDETFISAWEGIGATDGVWYKYTANRTDTIAIRGVCKSWYEDGYIIVHVFQGTSLDDLTLVSSDDPPGRFFFGDTVEEGDPLLVDVVEGQDYYIRVATWSGGSEDFDIFVDTYQVYLNLTASGTEEMHGTLIDTGDVYLNLQASGTDVYHASLLTDAATIPLALRPITTYEAQGVEYTETATVLLDLRALGGECFSTFSPQLLGEGEAELRFQTAFVETRWTGDAELRWGEGEILVEGINC